MLATYMPVPNSATESELDVSGSIYTGRDSKSFQTMDDRSKFGCVDLLNIINIM
jgi:hypothetical protein